MDECGDVSMDVPADVPMDVPEEMPMEYPEEVSTEFPEEMADDVSLDMPEYDFEGEDLDDVPDASFNLDDDDLDLFGSEGSSDEHGAPDLETSLDDANADVAPSDNADTELPDGFDPYEGFVPEDWLDGYRNYDSPSATETEDTQNFDDDEDDFDPDNMPGILTPEFLDGYPDYKSTIDDTPDSWEPMSEEKADESGLITNSDLEALADGPDAVPDDVYAKLLDDYTEESDLPTTKQELEDADSRPNADNLDFETEASDPYEANIVHPIYQGGRDGSEDGYLEINNHVGNASNDFTGMDGTSYSYDELSDGRLVEPEGEYSDDEVMSYAEIDEALNAEIPPDFKIEGLDLSQTAPDATNSPSSDTSSDSYSNEDLPQSFRDMTSNVDPKTQRLMYDELDFSNGEGNDAYFGAQDAAMAEADNETNGYDPFDEINNYTPEALGVPDPFANFDPNKVDPFAHAEFNDWVDSLKAEREAREAEDPFADFEDADLNGSSQPTELDPRIQHNLDEVREKVRQSDEFIQDINENGYPKEGLANYGRSRRDILREKARRARRWF